MHDGEWWQGSTEWLPVGTLRRARAPNGVSEADLFQQRHSGSMSLQDSGVVAALLVAGFRACTCRHHETTKVDVPVRSTLALDFPHERKLSGQSSVDGGGEAWGTDDPGLLMNILGVINKYSV